MWVSPSHLLKNIQMSQVRFFDIMQAFPAVVRERQNKRRRLLFPRKKPRTFCRGGGLVGRGCGYKSHCSWPSRSTTGTAGIFGAGSSSCASPIIRIWMRWALRARNLCFFKTTSSKSSSASFNVRTGLRVGAYAPETKPRRRGIEILVRAMLASFFRCEKWRGPRVLTKTLCS